MKVAVTCLALLCVVVAIISTVRAELQEDLSDSESLDVEQFEGINIIYGMSAELINLNCFITFFSG